MSKSLAGRQRALPRTARDLDQIVAWSLLRSARKLDRSLAHAIAAYELTPVQFGVLAQLVVEPMLTQAELAARIDVRPQSMNYLLDVMIGRGWVERSTAGKRGRPNPIRITASGEELLSTVWPVVKRINSAGRSPGGLGLSAADTRELVRILLLLLETDA